MAASVLVLCAGALTNACGRSTRESSSADGVDTPTAGDPTNDSSSGGTGSNPGGAGGSSESSGGANGPGTTASSDGGTGGALATGTGGHSDPALEWVAIPAGRYDMGGGNEDPPPGVPVEVFISDAPIHRVALQAFELTRTEVTVAQYRACVVSGECSEPEAGSSANYCSASSGENNWLAGDRDAYPVNCITPTQAAEFCAWSGGRLPSEAEWEYAARSGGQALPYAWGDDAPACSLAAVRLPAQCGTGSRPPCECGNVAEPVCSNPDGNTEQGLCDVTGNVSELVEDEYHPSYESAPTDGSAWGVGRTSSQGGLVRGGSYKEGDSFKLRVTSRTKGASAHALIGVRCAR